MYEWVVCEYQIWSLMKWVSDHIVNFKKMLKQLKFESFILSNEKNKNILERSSTLRVSRAEIWLTVYRSIYIIRMQGSIDSY